MSRVRTYALAVSLILLLGAVSPAVAGDATGRIREFFVNINRVLADGPNPLRTIEDLHFVLTRTSLRRLPLWMLGSDDVQQQIADTAEEPGGSAQYVIGIRALVARNYAAAVDYFSTAERRGLRDRTTRPLVAYAMCLAGQFEAAARLSEREQDRDADSVHFWEWLRSEFHL